ncbi:MAG: hypothetical protein KF749_02560 [Bacteroidetes bacterium]|nr:hypothetical protein [Bacteroidota bacterium]MCW5897420.1 hypothetical protein [Bacteroidota bacterium]
MTYRHFLFSYSGFQRTVFATVWMVFILVSSTRCQWTSSTSGSTDPLSAVTHAGGSRWYAVGARGFIACSEDSGVTWSKQSSGTNTWLSAVSFVDENTGWIVGWNGRMLTTSNAGEVWLQYEGGTKKSLYGVSFSDKRNGAIVGFEGTILRTKDGGATWVTQPGGTTANLRGVFLIDSVTGIAVGSEGTILRTTDAGETWTRRPSGKSTLLHNVRFTNAGFGIAVGEAGTILTTTNGGVDWREAPSNTTSDLWDVCFADTKIGFIVGSAGALLKSTDGRNIWANQPAGTETDLRGVSFANGTIGVVVGVHGTILRTQNGGGCEKFPFPRNIVYQYGAMPRQRNHGIAEASYMSWKTGYVTSQGACGFRRVLFDDMRSTTSEGIGYGMLLAVTFGDQALFDDLWSYYQRFLNKSGFMDWHISDSCTVLGYGGATDADEDAAFALLLADEQWCSDGKVNYREDAQVLIDRIFTHQVEPETFVLKPGNGTWGGSHLLNPSYFAPAYYRAFEAATGNPGWSRVMEKCYEVLRNAAHPETGLVPDWCKADGSPGQGRENNHYYYWDATRTPWRIALDYLWYGNEEARQFCLKIAGFARTIGAANIGNGYSLDGKPMGPERNSIFVGPFGAAAMVAGEEYQPLCDSLYRENALREPPAVGNYYNWSLRTLTLLLQTGNFRPPDLFRRP